MSATWQWLYSALAPFRNLCFYCYGRRWVWMRVSGSSATATSNETQKRQRSHIGSQTRVICGLTGTTGSGCHLLPEFTGGVADSQNPRSKRSTYHMASLDSVSEERPLSPFPHLNANGEYCDRP